MDAAEFRHLGTLVRPITRVHGKSSNRVYRLDTDNGSFAIKKVDLTRGWTYRHDDIFRLERAAFEAGVPMPEPVSATADTLIHRWVDGEALPEEPVSQAFATAVGEIVARLHALDVEWTDVPTVTGAPRDWAILAKRAASTGQPWAAELKSLVNTFLAIAELVDSCERPGPVVLTHRDIQPWNLLAHGGEPVVLDWELSGLMDLSGELGSIALSLSKGHSFDDVHPVIFRSVLDGYVSGGGTLPQPGPSWFVYMLGGWLGFTRWNVGRCVAGQAGSDPDSAAVHAEIRNALEGLPDLFRRLSEFHDTLLRW